MTATGHNERTTAIVEQIKRRQREVVKHVNEKETLAQEWITRLERVERLLEKFAKSQEFVLPNSFQEMRERIEALEDRPVDITPTEPTELQDAITELGNDLADFSRAVLTHISVLQKRQDASEARFSELPTVLAQIQAERRRQA